MRTYARSLDTCRLPMTPMIDVVCLLLIFFLVVFRPPELLSALSASNGRPSADPAYPTSIRVDITAHGYVVQGIPSTLQRMDSRLAHVASYSDAIPVRIHCTHDSTHSQLVKVLDICAKNRLHTVSITTPAP